ncbi:Immunoglobulin Lambda Variable 7-46 [Manis pentadactyla]|nr:Immunoglobulin Lambda Variable 7-46 [Manis pentadactyla]
MAQAPLLLILLAHCTGTISQAVVTQETSLTTSPGGTVILTCGSGAGAITTSNYANWFQQKPYQAPQSLIGATSTRVPGVPVRFSGSLLGNKATLSITGAQPKDEAEYFCALWFSNHSHSDRLGGEMRHKPPGSGSPPTLVYFFFMCAELNTRPG